MDEKRFWDVIGHSCPADESPEEWESSLHEQLMQLLPREIVHFDWMFQAKLVAAYTIDLWGAAYTINGGASDDGFFYFRCWLVGKGKKIFETALADPDSLADHVTPTEDYEAGLHAVARYAWFEATGQPDTTPLDNAWLGPLPEEELKGEDWDFDDDAEVRRRFPRLAALYLDAEDEDE